jgi:UrcA family protein
LCGIARQISLKISANLRSAGLSEPMRQKEKLMNSTHAKLQDLTLPALFALLAAAGVCAVARGAETPTSQIVVQGPTTTIIGQDYRRPLQQSTVRLGVRYDPVTLTTNSGVALLKDAVTQAAFQACIDADPTSAPESRCISNAIDQAQPQIAQAVARARGNVNG